MRKSIYFLPLALLLAFLLLPTPTAADNPPMGEYNFRLIDVDFISMNSQSVQAFGVNNRGDVVGSYQLETEPGLHRARGLLFTRGNLYSIHYPDAMATNLYGINNRGELAGNYRDADNELWHGFTLLHGKYAAVDVPGAIQTWIRQINDNGDVTGEWSDGSKSRGFVRRDGAFITIEVPGATYTAARGINPEGDVVGYYQDPTKEPARPGRYWPFLFMRNGIYVTDSPEPEPARTYTFNGINAAGDIVGCYIQRDEPTPLYIGFVMRRNGSSTKVMIPGYFCTTLTGIAANGKIAATAWNFVQGGGPAWTYWAYLVDPQGPPLK